MKILGVFALVCTAVTLCQGGSTGPATQDEITACVGQKISANDTLAACVAPIITGYNYTNECRSRKTHDMTRKAANRCMFETIFSCSRQPSFAKFLTLDDTLIPLLTGYNLTLERTYEISCESETDPRRCDASSCQPAVTEIPQYTTSQDIFQYLTTNLPAMTGFCDALQCVQDFGDNCMQTIDMVRHMYRINMLSIVPNAASMTETTYGNYVDLIDNSCPRTSEINAQCIRTELAKTSFGDCIDVYSSTVGTGQATTCTNYDGLMGCVDGALKVPCGDGSAKAIATAIRFADSRLPFGCPPNAGNPISSSVALLVFLLLARFF